MITIIGMGEDGLQGLAPAARVLLAQAELIVGGRRHLALLGKTKARQREWPSPFAKAKAMLRPHLGKAVVVLASGDPMWFGAGATLADWFGSDAVAVLPHPGAFSLAAARLKWPLQDCLCLTAHGRPLDALALHFAPGARLLVLSENGATPAALAALLERHGFGGSRLWVLEHLGGPQERISETPDNAADLNLVAVECLGAGLSRVPGLPDDAFDHDGQLTKRTVRAATLALLAPQAGEMLWDIGAGCGSVAIEWMRAGGRAAAVECRPERLERIARNAIRLGVPSLEIVAGRAPSCLPGGLPDAVFVGGGVSVPGLLETCWARLAPDGRLVANAVTAEGEAALLAFHARHGGALQRLSVAALAPVGGFHAWHPAMPVTQYWGTKP